MTTETTLIQEAPPPAVGQVVEHLFRHETGKMVSSLTRIFGVKNMSLAEDVVQEALVKALQTWPYYGVPENPAGWMMQVARNLALDAVRRQSNFQKKEPEIVAMFHRQQPARPDMQINESGFCDDRLPMMFVCCHPLIPPEAQVALALKTLCGFGITEISRAFLTNDEVIAKRLTRAKKKLRDARIEFEMPPGDELSQRIEGVLRTLYLLFNEGYKASSGDRLVRDDLCHEAIRLTKILAQHPAGDLPATHALLSLMYFNAARLNTRVDSDGRLLRLQDQDRSQWDKRMIAEAMYHMARSACENTLTAYHLQAAIAACHCTAPSYGCTDWNRILSLYDELLKIDNRSIVALNRAVAISKVHGTEAAIKAVSEIQKNEKLDSYYLLYAVLGEFELQMNRPATAAEMFKKSMELTDLMPEKSFLAERIRGCDELTVH